MFNLRDKGKQISGARPRSRTWLKPGLQTRRRQPLACGKPRVGRGDRGGRRGMGATRRRDRGGGRPGLCNLELVFQITGNHGCCPSLGNVTLGTRGSAPAMYDAPAMNWNASAEPRDPSATESRLRWRRVRVDAASSLAPEHAEPASPGSTTEYGADRFPLARPVGRG